MLVVCQGREARRPYRTDAAGHVAALADVLVDALARGGRDAAYVVARGGVGEGVGGGQDKEGKQAVLF